jgi:hypothetical protein
MEVIDPPGRRENQFVMVKNWLTVLGTQAVVWNVPSTEVTRLQTLTTAADAALAVAQSSERTPVITANCKAAFDALVAKMRFIKSRYFLSPRQSRGFTDFNYTLSRESGFFGLIPNFE